MITLHLNITTLIGLGLLPAGFIAFYVIAFIFRSMEIGAVAIAGVVTMACWIAGIVMIVLGIGMEIH